MSGGSGIPELVPECSNGMHEDIADSVDSGSSWKNGVFFSKEING